LRHPPDLVLLDLLYLDGQGVGFMFVATMAGDEIDLGGDLAKLREQNLRRVLSVLLANRRALTQPEIAAEAGLSRTTVSGLIASLGSVLISEVKAKNGSERGRPLMLWRLDPKSAFSVGIDFGRTHVAVIATDPFGEVVGEPISEKFNDVLAHPHQALALAANLVERLISRLPLPCESIAAVTVGLPGAVDSSTGVMETDGATLAWAGIDVRDEIRKRWPHETVPARLADNNANLGAIAEHRFGAGRNAESLLFIKWSSGVGGGLILGNWLWRGRSGVAGEVGHLPVSVTKREAEILELPSSREDWSECSRCGQKNCLEQLTGGRSVATAAGLPSLADVVDAALGSSQPEKTTEAREVLKVAARLIGKAIGPALTLLDVERVIIGGVAGDPALYSLLVEDVSRGMSGTAFRRALSDVSLELGALNRHAPVRGAAIAGLDAHGISFLMSKAVGAQVQEGSARLSPALAGAGR
jgi:predicted NBD/HSP70 family sugar kinase